MEIIEKLDALRKMSNRELEDYIQLFTDASKVRKDSVAFDDRLVQNLSLAFLLKERDRRRSKEK